MNNNQIDVQNVSKTIDSLNDLLANFQIHYQNLRGFHWNIKGSDFFQLHLKFEEYYTAAAATIDEIAERILTLGGVPLHSYEAFLKQADIKSHQHVSAGKVAVTAILEENRILLNKMRAAVKLAADNDDEGTVDMLTPIINTKEKDNWMLNAYLS